MNNNTSIVPGSLQALATQNNKSIAETFTSAEVLVLVDTSGSMAANDSRNNQSRYEVACQELAQLQAQMPGKIGVLSFSGNVQFCPGGVPLFEGDSTNLRRALEFAKIADVPGIRFIVISDGCPDNPAGALEVAKTYHNRIDTIYVGPEIEGAGREFLHQLANVHGGQSLTADRAKELSASVQQLLLIAG